MPRVRRYVSSRVARIYEHETPEAVAAKGVVVALGTARFTDAHTIEILAPAQPGEGGDARRVLRRVTAEAFVICTGASPVVPPALAGVPHHTYETIWDNELLPRRMAVVGTGPIGCELGQAYARLGAAVTMIGGKLLPREDASVQEALGRVFAAEGIAHAPGRAAGATVGEGGEVTIEVRLAGGDALARVGADMVFVAAGRRPNVASLNLAAAGVGYTARGIAVRAHLPRRRCRSCALRRGARRRTSFCRPT